MSAEGQDCMGMSCGRTARSGEKRQRWEDKDESKEGMFREPENPPRAEGSNNVPERVRLAVPKAAKKERRNRKSMSKRQVKLGQHLKESNRKTNASLYSLKIKLQ